MTLERRDVVIGTAGHIDHGKTQLLRALTGIDADRLKEEKERGITIDIGFAPWIDPPYFIGFIDVPGHERFVKNMLAGAGGIDGILLVVAGDEGVMPQTREHLEIATLLGIKRGVVAITKMDTADPELVDLVEEDIQALTDGTFLAAAPIIRTSAVSGQGIPELKAALRHLADELEVRDRDGIPRLFIDRVFTIRGFGAVVTGTTFSGIFHRNDPVAVLPGDVRAKIRTIQVYEQEAEEALPGQRTALNLQGIDREILSRGMAVTRPEIFTPTQVFYARFRLLPSFGKPLKNLAPVHVYHGSAELLGRIQLLDRVRLEPGDDAFVQIRLEAPTLLWPRDHYVVRQYSPLVTMGGGVVLETHAERFRKKALTPTLDRLERLYGADDDHLLTEVLAAETRDALTLTELANRTGLAENRLRRLLGALNSRGTIRALSPDGGAWMADSTIKNLTGRAFAVLDAYFAQNPFSPGIRKQELRSQMKETGSDAFEFLLSSLQEEGVIVVRDGRVTPSDRQVVLDEQVGGQVDGLLDELRRAGPEGLTEGEVHHRLFDTGKPDTSLMDLLLQRKDLVRVTADYFLHREVLEEMLQRIRQEVPRGGTFDVPSFKEWFNLTRKRAIPLLEFLDRQGVTVRMGNNRQLR